MTAVLILLMLGVAVWLYFLFVFKDKELVSKKELKELKSEYKIMDQAMREAFINPDQAQYYISTAFNQIQVNKNSAPIKEVDQ